MHSTLTRPPTCEFKSNFYFCVANTLLVIKIKRTSYYTVRVPKRVVIVSHGVK